MSLAEWWSQWGTCTSLKTGAVIVDEAWHVLTSGYNGAPRGFPHCSEVPHLLDAGGHCLTALHAEDNSILQAARLGVAVAGGWMYCTHRPCVRCARRIVQVGLRGITYKHDYDSDHLRAEVLDWFARGNVIVRQLGGETPCSFHTTTS